MPYDSSYRNNKNTIKSICYVFIFVVNLFLVHKHIHIIFCFLRQSMFR